MAVIWYIFSPTIYIAWISGALYLGIQTEVNSSWIPESEPIVAVGQWSPWVVFAFGAIAAVIFRMNGSSRWKKQPIVLEEDGDECLAPRPLHVAYRKAQKQTEVSGSQWQYYMNSFWYLYHEFKYWWEYTIDASAEETPAKGYREAVVDADIEACPVVWDNMSLHPPMMQLKSSAASSRASQCTASSV